MDQQRFDETVQQHQRGRRHRQHAKRDHALLAHRINEQRQKGKVEHDRLWVEQGDQEPLPKGALPRGRRRRAALLRAQAPHADAQPGQIGRAHPLQARERHGVRVQQRRHAPQRAPDQDLVARHHPQRGRHAAANAPLRRARGNHQVARARDHQEQPERDHKGAVIGDAEHIELSVGDALRRASRERRVYGTLTRTGPPIVPYRRFHVEHFRRNHTRQRSASSPGTESCST